MAKGGNKNSFESKIIMCAVLLAAFFIIFPSFIVRGLFDDKGGEFSLVIGDGDEFIAETYGFYKENAFVPDFGHVAGAPVSRHGVTERGEKMYVYDYNDVPDAFRWRDYKDALTDSGWRFCESVENDGVYMEFYADFGTTGEQGDVMAIGESGHDEVFIIFTPSEG